MKNLTKKRLLMREANDMKIKAMVDLLSAPTPGEKSPLTELFGKIVGLPFNKSHTFRPGNA
jgi:hypothetical protein